MDITITVATIVVAVAFGGLIVGGLLRAYLRFRGTRVVTCPATGASVAVELNARRAAVTSLLGDTQYRLVDCTRWPEMRNCGQGCVSQIAAAPTNCLVRTILQQWYEGKSCVLCARPIGEVNWMTHQPALVDDRGNLVTWRDVPAERIRELLATHRPICWSCHVAESFRHEHPDLVVDRPDRSASAPREPIPAARA